MQRKKRSQRERGSLNEHCRAERAPGERRRLGRVAKRPNNGWVTFGVSILAARPGHRSSHAGWLTAAAALPCQEARRYRSTKLAPQEGGDRRRFSEPFRRGRADGWRS